MKTQPPHADPLSGDLPAMVEYELPGLDLVHQGKVRDVYAIDANRLLMVTTDRLSAFDVVLPDPIPGKGAILTALSNYWFGLSESVVKNHLTGDCPEPFIKNSPQADALARRSVVVKRLQPLPVEAIVRGYLIGSGWQDYQRDQAISGVELPAGLRLASQLPTPIFTPSSKASVGDHDENIDFATMIGKVSEELARQIRQLSLSLYQQAAKYALERGIVIADTKFEFGLDQDGSLVLMDEVLTPDSSRFWPAGGWQEGTSPTSFDKQFVRDYLATLDWDKTPPGPRLPAEIIARTADKYREVYKTLIGA